MSDKSGDLYHSLFKYYKNMDKNKKTCVIEVPKNSNQLKPFDSINNCYSDKGKGVTRIL